MFEKLITDLTDNKSNLSAVGCIDKWLEGGSGLLGKATNPGKQKESKIQASVKSVLSVHRNCFFKAKRNKVTRSMRFVDELKDMVKISPAR